ncbi:MATE efflux family protein [Collybia nuda]|uniref:MATE efflux family protein n=1 Tax=Collybia nuda TaxID=64659 RepID=A0A9P5XYJ6_9AGAR|nr:MATE efflux family protein [Collybia nuda]
MSSTFAHYQQPGSLPSDYAILSRYAGHHPDGEPQSEVDSDGDDTETEDTSRRATSSSLLRRTSFPSAPHWSQHTTMIPAQSHHFKHIPVPGPLPSENTPLLNPPVPRIDEPLDRTPDNGGTMKIFWEELRILTRYAAPVFGTHILEYSLIMASVISIGHLSTTALAAISLGSMTASVSGFSIIQGFTSALDTMLPPAWTSSQPQLVGLWAQRMTVVMSVVLMPVFLTWFNAENILLFLKQDPEVAHLAAVYLRWVSMGLPAYTFNCISRRYFQSQGLFAVPTRIIFIIAPINVLLNYTLVWGPKAVRLGFIGAPIATAISFNLVSLMSICYGLFFVPSTAWYPLSRRMFTSLGVLVQLGLAGVGQTASEWWAWELVALAASLLGPVVLATQSVLLVSASSTFQAPFALGVATSVRIGNLLGEGKAQRAGIASNTSILMALVLSATSSTMFLVFRNSWAYLFNSDPEVVNLVASILPLVALFQVFDGNAAVTAGILRARGKQVLGALLNLSSYYIIGIPFGMWLAFSKGMGIHGLWIGLTVSLVYCSVFGTVLCLRTDWDREVWKVTQRLKDQDKVNRAEADEENRLTQ